MTAPHYAGFIDADRLEVTPTFTTLDASVARRVGSVTFMVIGRNLTDAYQADLDRGPLRDAAYVYGPRMPRSFGISARWG